MTRERGVGNLLLDPQKGPATHFRGGGVSQFPRPPPPRRSCRRTHRRRVDVCATLIAFPIAAYWDANTTMREAFAGVGCWDHVWIPTAVSGQW
jgi:hypothetical protein